MTLKEYIFRYAVNQTEFAKKLGKTPARITQLKQGAIPPLPLAKAIEVLTDGLVTVEDWEVDIDVITKNSDTSLAD